MGAKIVGFAKKVDGYRTSVGFMNSDIFKNACKETASKQYDEGTGNGDQTYGAILAKLMTRRQASKFRKGCGIVFQTITTK